MEKRKRSDLWPYLITTSVTGRSHLQAGLTCQDASLSFRHEDGICGVVIADGLSSAKFGGKGANIAVKEVKISLEHSLSFTAMTDPDAILITAAENARTALDKESRRRYNSARISDYATTLIIVIFLDREVAYGHIGDGIVVGTEDGISGVISPPGSAEYASETASLTQPDWEREFRTSIASADAVICGTDGCQAALAQKNHGIYYPYDPFITPFLGHLYKLVDNEQNLELSVHELLNSQKMHTLSSDDKTLAVILGEPSELQSKGPKRER